MADTVERPNTVAGLIEKRREIAGQIEHYQRILNELIIDLDHIDRGGTARFMCMMRARVLSNGRI